MSGKTESESHALRARRAEGTEASTVIVQAGSDRPMECRIMIEHGRTNDVPAAALDPLARIFTPKREFCEREREQLAFQYKERERPALRASHPTDLSLEAVACLPAGSTVKSGLSDGDNVSVSTEASCPRAKGNFRR